MKLSVNMLSIFMEDWIVCKLDCALAVIFDDGFFFLTFTCIIEQSPQLDGFACSCTQRLVLSFT